MLSLQGAVHLPPSPTTEALSWVSPFVRHASLGWFKLIAKPQPQSEQRNCKACGRSSAVYLGSPCTYCCPTWKLMWPCRDDLNNWIYLYFVSESSAWSSYSDIKVQTMQSVLVFIDIFWVFVVINHGTDKKMFSSNIMPWFNPASN